MVMGIYGIEIIEKTDNFIVINGNESFRRY